MAGKLDGNAIVSGSITSTQLSTSVNNSITQGGGPKITQIQITDSSYNVLDDTAVNTSGGYIKITGTGFNAGAVVIIGTVNATSTAYISSTTLNVQVPAAVAGTYVVYVVNTDGGTAIAVNGLTYSALPNWVTGSTLPSGTSTIPISIQLDATDATNYALAAGNTLPTGLTLTSGGLLSGTVTVGVETVYSFTVVATDAQLQDSPRSFTITITVGDPYFYLTTLLLPGNGTNNGNNNAFIDSSTNAAAITRNGNTTQGTYTPYSLTGWSNYFDGTGDYLTVPGTTEFAFGTGAWTIEFWVYPLAYGSTVAGAQLFGTVNGASSNYSINLGENINSFRIISNATGVWADNLVVSAGGGPALNTWSHMAISRDGANISIYKNGTRVATSSSAVSWNFTGTTGVIGRFNDGSITRDFNGYLSNLRVIKGSALYNPTQSTITVPTAPLTAVANTSLLTCQNNRFKDNSTNNFTITRIGDVLVQSFEPFAPSANYTAGTVSGSAYLDGTGDYLQVAGNTNNALGAGDFTVEGWFFSTGTTGQGGSGEQGIIGSGITTSSRWTIRLQNSPTKIMSWWLNGPGNNVTGSTPILQNTWYHFALVRSGSGSNNVKLYLNGVLESQGTNTYTVPGEDIMLGRTYINLDGEYWNGYISNLRIVKGTAVYTSNFTPPTAPVTAITNTALLCNFTNGQITDATSKNLLETVADAKISTAQSKWGGSSMYFDGTGDYLYPLNLNMLALGTQAFTIEFWFNTTSSTQYAQFIGNETTGLGFTILINQTSSTSGDIAIFNGASGQIHITSGTSYRDGNWHFLAFTRNSSGSRLFIDGVQQGSTNAGQSSTSFDGSPIRYAIGNNLQFAGRGYAGYLQDLRITRGYARYTSNFSVPTSAFPTL